MKLRHDGWKVRVCGDQAIAMHREPAAGILPRVEAQPLPLDVQWAVALAVQDSPLGRSEDAGKVLHARRVGPARLHVTDESTGSFHLSALHQAAERCQLCREVCGPRSLSVLADMRSFCWLSHFRDPCEQPIRQIVQFY